MSALSGVGLKTHIWNNNAKSLILLATFPMLLMALAWAVFLLMASGPHTSNDPYQAALEAVYHYFPLIIGGVTIWFLIAWYAHQGIINMATGAKPLERSENIRLYNMLENLCISRGMSTPQLFIIESTALNAYATGLTEGKFSITVTRGLVEILKDDELEAVLAHELSHIINRDVRLLVISVIFVGIISFVAQMIFRNFFRTKRSRSEGKGGGILILVAIGVIALSYVFSLLVRFSISRSREFMADAGAVELTKNPTALIGALRKISGISDIKEAPKEVKSMFFDNTSVGFTSMFSTHPSIDKRIEVLKALGGEEIDTATTPAQTEPWGQSEPSSSTDVNSTSGPW